MCNSNESQSRETKLILGIDLGTTNSAISIVRTGTSPEIIELKGGKMIMPSCVEYGDNKEVLSVGYEAYKKRHLSNVVYSSKSLMGTGKKITITTNNSKYEIEPYKVASDILKGLVNNISDKYPNVKDVVITVPAAYDVKAIEDTKKAAELAGLNLIMTSKEPTAGALAYIANMADDDPLKNKDNMTIIVYDLGGGTFDVSIVDIMLKSKNTKIEKNSTFSSLYELEDEDLDDPSSNDSFIVRKTRGDLNLGGDDIDDFLTDRIISSVCRELKYHENIARIYREKVKLNAEMCKKDMSLNSVFSIPVEFMTKKGMVKANVKLNYRDFIDATMSVYKKTKILMDELVSDYNENIDAIVTIGGSTKNKIIQDLLRNDFPSIPIYNGLNPDEAVALGAAVQARSLSGVETGLDIIDVVSTNIGILSKGLIETVIYRDSLLPTSSSKRFTNVYDDQESISVDVYSGTSKFKDECSFIGTLVIDLPEKKKAGESKILITLKVDSVGLLKCFVSVDGIEKEAVISNILGSSKEKESKPKSLKVTRWYKYASTLENNEEAYYKLIDLIESYEAGQINETEVSSFIRKTREISLNEKS